jgi:hypothetical protein
MSTGKLTRLVISTLALVLGISGSFTTHKPAVGAVPADPGDQSSAQEKTAGQEFKNVQVLKDLPASQLRQTMFFIASSLGVRCDYCHVQQFEKDEKQAKQTARKMISMMQRINAENFGGKMQVNCATCHQGRTAPLSMPPLPSESGGESDSAVDSAITVDNVLDRYVKALGGKEAVQKITSRSGKGTLIAPNGMKLAFQTFAAPPNKTLFILETPQGIYKEGFSGSIGWIKNQNGVTEMSPSALEQTKRHSDFYRSIRLKEQYVSIELAGKTVIDSRAVYEIRGKTASGTSEKLYFDSTTGLLVRWVIEESTPFGPVPEAFDFDDYRDSGGTKVPFLVKRRQTGVMVIQHYEEVNQNAAVDLAQFEKPAAQKPE